jgi:AcrR family transcriptional regulator
LRADAVRNRARVLDAADELFAEQGLAVTVDAIAERAGVGPGTVYRHFPAKESLVEAVIVDRLNAMMAQGRQLLASDPGSALIAFLRSLFSWLSSDRAMVEVLSGFSVSLGRAVPDTEQDFRTLLVDMVAAGHFAGTLRPGITADDVKSLLSFARTDPDAASAERIATVVVEGLRAPTDTGGMPPKT